MHLLSFLPLVFLPSAYATTFHYFTDKTCQKYDGTYVTVTADELKDLAVQEYPTADVSPQASRFLTTPDDKIRCPSNSDDTFKWVR